MEATPARFSGTSAEEWATRYEAVRRQAIQEGHSLESGWELALLVRRGVVAWMRAWPTVEASPSYADSHTNDSQTTQAQITIPSSVCEEVTSVLVSMILPQRFVELQSVS